MCLRVLEPPFPSWQKVVGKRRKVIIFNSDDMKDGAVEFAKAPGSSGNPIPPVIPPGRKAKPMPGFPIFKIFLVGWNMAK